MILEIKVIANGSKDEIVRFEENRLVIKVRAVPEKGKANQNCIDFLAKTLQIPKSKIKIASGQTSRLKKIEIDAISLEQIKAKIAHSKTV